MNLFIIKGDSIFIHLRLRALWLVLFVVTSLRCDLVPALDPIITPTTFGGSVSSINWCTCNFFAAGGFEETDLGIFGLLGIFQFDPAINALSLTYSTTLANQPQSVVWCPSCRFLAVGTINSGGIATIQLYGFDPLNPGNLQLLTTETIVANYVVDSISWCPSCRFLAAAMRCAICRPGDPGYLQAYSFDPDNPGNLVAVGPLITVDNDSLSIKWCPDCTRLLGAGSLGLYVYDFDPDNGLTFNTLFLTPATYESIDLCNNCSYVAAAGYITDTFQGTLDIYFFDPQSTQSFTLVSTVTLFGDGGSIFTSASWCQGCDNLAAAGATLDSIGNQTDILQLYHFDSSTGTLSLISSQTLGFTINSIDWCDRCCYLASSGVAGGRVGTGYIQLFRGNPCGGPSTPTNLTAQKMCHRFPTQIDLINRICWNAVDGAVSYNVYADAELSILLATITNSPLCYAQHQICIGQIVTYYVTAVDANGNQSEPAIVTI